MHSLRRQMNGLPGFQRTSGSFGRSSLQPNARCRHLSERLRLAVPPANGWPTGDYFVQLTFRAAVSMMNVAFELLDGVLLIFDHRLDQVPDRDHRDDPPLLYYRQMPDPALGHEMHAVLHRLIG